MVDPKNPGEGGHHTCLFTGAVLDGSTRLEHTILRGLGGRVRSTIVTSSDFNEKSSWLDEMLLDPYSRIMRQLGPLLATEHKAGDMEVEITGQENQKIRLDGDGNMHLRGHSILSRDEKGIPSTYVGEDIDQMRKAVKTSRKDPDKAIYSEAPLTRSMEAFHKGVIIAYELEVAALKCGLVAFDHLLAITPNLAPRFTRDERLEPVRRLVRETVLNRKRGSETLGWISLGLQYDRIGQYQQLRSRLPLDPQPFEHVLLVTSDPFAGVLDMVWWVLGIDPFGFRLSQEWKGEGTEPFTLIFAQGTLFEAKMAGPIRIADTDRLCASTINCHLPHRPVTEEDGEAVASLIGAQRTEGYRAAVVLVERSCPEIVLAHRLAQTSRVQPAGDRRASTAIRERLQRLFPEHATDPEDGDKFEAIIDEELNRLLGPERLQAQVPEADVDAQTTVEFWQPFIQAHRSVFEILIKQFGRPRLVLSQRVVADPDSDHRQLGNLPY